MKIKNICCIGAGYVGSPTNRRKDNDEYATWRCTLNLGRHHKHRIHGYKSTTDIEEGVREFVGWFKDYF